MVFVIHWNESAMDLHVFPIPVPPPTSLSTRSLWVFPVHQVRALVSCIQPGLVICFTLDNIHVSMLFSWNIPPLPSPTESKSLHPRILETKAKKEFVFLIFIWLHHVLAVAYKIFSWGMWDPGPWPGREPRPPALGMYSLNHCTTREVPGRIFLWTYKADNKVDMRRLRFENSETLWW